MRRSLILSLLLFAFFSPLRARAAAEWHQRLEPALAEARATDRLVLVDLYAEWCGWCKRLEREVFASPEFLAAAKDLVLLRVNVEDGGEGSRIQARYGAETLPTTLILDAKQARVGEIGGFLPVAAFVRTLHEEVARYRALIAEADEALVSGTRERRQELAAELHRRGDGARAAALYRRLLDLPGQDDQARTWLGIALADALRLDHRFTEAERILEAVHTAASQDPELGNPRDPGELRERIGLLAIQLAEDQGDCHKTQFALEAFVREHPRSGWAAYARQALAALNSDARCA